MLPHFSAEDLLDVEVDKLELVADYYIFFFILVDLCVFSRNLFALVPIGCLEVFAYGLVDVLVVGLLKFLG